VRLSRRDASAAYLGSTDQWQHAEQALREVAKTVDLADRGLELVEADGQAAFYGPKLDLQVHDRRGHEETIATVQLDFNQPKRFNLNYDAADESQQPVVMIHRGTVGAMERVVAALLERYQGRLPLWLAPVQICVMPIHPAHDDAAHDLVADLLAAGLRPRLETRGSLGARIHASRQRRDCLIAVLGQAEIDTHQLQVTDIAAGFTGPVARDQFIQTLQHSHRNRTTTPNWAIPD